MLEKCPKCWWTQLCHQETETICICGYRHWVYSDAQIPLWYIDTPDWFKQDQEQIQIASDMIADKIHWNSFIIHVTQEWCNACEKISKYMNNKHKDIELYKIDSEFDRTLIEILWINKKMVDWQIEYMDTIEVPIVICIVWWKPLWTFQWWSDWDSEKTLDLYAKKIRWHLWTQ